MDDTKTGTVAGAAAAPVTAILPAPPKPLAATPNDAVKQPAPGAAAVAEKPPAPAPGAATAAVAEKPPAPAPGPAAMVQSDAERAVADSYAHSKDGETFAAAMIASGITLARVTVADLSAMTAATHDDPARRFPVLAVGELVAVDRFGDVHRLDPLRPDAADIESRFGEPRTAQVQVAPVAGSVSDAHAAFSALYQPTPEMTLRARLRASIEHIRTYVGAARNGDPRAGGEAMHLLTNLVHDMLDTVHPRDHLRDALGAMAAGRTEPARVSLMAVRSILTSGPESWKTGPVVARIDEAVTALAAGYRADAVRIVEDLFDDLDHDHEPPTPRPRLTPAA